MQLEAIPESLKNMLLVMDTAGIFHSADSRTGFSDLWEITWERIVCFLPHLREELFKQTVIAGKQQAHGDVHLFICFDTVCFKQHEVGLRRFDVTPGA